MKAYTYVGCAVISEITGTMLMKRSAGFTHLWESLGTLVFYCATFGCFLRSLKYPCMGLSLSIRAVAGVMLISLTGWLVNGHWLHSDMLIDMALILSSGALINYLSKRVSWPSASS